MVTKPTEETHATTSPSDAKKQMLKTVVMINVCKRTESETNHENTVLEEEAFYCYISRVINKTTQSNTINAKPPPILYRKNRRGKHNQFKHIKC